MELIEILTILSCASSTVTMILVIVAVLPHVKNGMAVIRDAVLWIAFLVVLALAGWLGWRQLVARPDPPSRRPAWASPSVPSAERDRGRSSARPDPFYAYRE
jgi:hypothetical protein